ncbi:MAG: N-methyl-L-tryptophan oxidase [Candidatus Sericytochromatia bacterium]
MKKIYEVIVIGIGAMGSSALYHLSKKNSNILGIDQFVPPHNLGSSYGETRIIREAYFEHPLYVPFIQNAYKLWDELQEKSDEQLIKNTTGLMLGDLESETVTGAELSAITHNLPYQKLDFQEINKRFNYFKPTDETYGIFEKNAGVLFPEKCITENLKQAKLNGAEVLNNTKIISWEQKSDFILLKSSDNEFRSKKIIISNGAWILDLLKINLPLEVSRETLFWIEDNNNNLKDCPIYIWEYEKDKIFYGFPTMNNMAKVAFHHQRNLTTADKLNRDISQEEKEKMLNIAHKYLNLKGEIQRQEVCMYTNTPDHHFLIDFYPDNENIIIASPCSGHGFKFSSIIGKILSEMIFEEKLSNNIDPFKINRLLNK